MSNTKLSPGMRKLLRDPSVLAEGDVRLRVYANDGATGTVSSLAELGLRAVLEKDGELSLSVPKDAFVDAVTGIAALPWVRTVRRMP